MRNWFKKMSQRTIVRFDPERYQTNEEAVLKLLFHANTFKTMFISNESPIMDQISTLFWLQTEIIAQF